MLICLNRSFPEINENTRVEFTRTNPELWIAIKTILQIYFLYANFTRHVHGIYLTVERSRDTNHVTEWKTEESKMPKLIKISKRNVYKMEMGWLIINLCTFQLLFSLFTIQTGSEIWVRVIIGAEFLAQPPTWITKMNFFLMRLKNENIKNVRELATLNR